MKLSDTPFAALCDLHRNLGFLRLSSASFQTSYEARCMAASPDGRRFAVGTKAGDVVAYERTDSAWKVLGDFGCQSPIRGLAFVGGHLIAGFGRGNFAVAVCGLNKLSDPARVRPPEASAALKNASMSGGWLTRFRRIIPLVPPGRIPSTTHEAPIALGLAEGRQVYVLAGSGAGWTVRVYENVGTWLEAQAQDEVKPRPETTRVVDACWVQAQQDPLLLLLCSSGETLIARWRDGAFQSTVGRNRTARLFDGSDAPYRALCYGQVGVVAQGQTSLHLLPADAASQDPETWTTTARLSSPGGAPIAMMSAVDEGAPSWRLKSVGGTPWPRAPDTVRWATGTSVGVRLHADQTEMRRRSPSRSSAHEESAGRLDTVRVAVGNDHVLQLEFEGDDGCDPTHYLFVTWRHHVAEAIRVFDLNAVEREIDARAPKRLNRAAARELAAQPGTAWWLVLRWIREEMRRPSRPRWVPSREGFSPPVLGQLAARDLVVLTGHTLRMLLVHWGRVPRGAGPTWTESHATAAARQYIVWIRRLITAAHELGAPAVRDVASAAYQGVRAAESTFGRGGEIWTHLGPFVGFLRKWVIEGRSYARKGVGLRQLFKANVRVGNDLDALCYQAQLVRARYDIAWIGDVVPNYQIWDLATPESLHREEEEHHRLGIALRWAGPSVKTQAAVRDLLKKDSGATSWEAGIPDKHRFVLAALTTGSIEARSSTRDAAIRFHDPEGHLGGANLEVDGARLFRRDREAYWERYRLGPYARAVTLVPAEEGGETFWLVFSSKGWMMGDRDEGHPGPNVHAVRIRPAMKEGELTLRIVSAHSAPAGSEVYSLLATDATTTTVSIVVGTRGQWAAPEQTDASRRPVFSIRMHGGALRIQDAEFTQGLIGTRSKDLDTQEGLQPSYNPSWSVVKLVQGSDAEGECYAVGAHDGTIRFFTTNEDRSTWSLIPSATISVGGSVWQMRQVLPLHYDSTQEPITLAYGTADGVIGVVQEYSVRSPGRRASGSWIQPSSRWHHIVHTREAGSIHGLVDYCELVRPAAADSTDADGRLGWCRQLMALSSAGQIAIFRVSAGPDELGDTYQSPKNHHHVRPRGSRVDRFRLADPRGARQGAQPARTRALVGVANTEATDLGSIPGALVAFQDGSLSRIELAFPRASERRRTAIGELLDVGLTKGAWWGDPNPSANSMVQCIAPRTSRKGHEGEDEREVLRWLRIVELAGMGQLLRFSIWRELAAAGKGIEDLCRELEHDGDPPDESQGDGQTVIARLDRLHTSVDDLSDLLRRRSVGVYERQPVDIEAAKMLWGEAARFANRLGHLCLKLLEHPPTQPQAVVRALKAYVRLNQAVDDLCNRWIGFDKSIEGKILAHSFANIFDWVDIVLLAGHFSGVDDGTLMEVRGFLLRLVLRRLSHTEPMVSLEALRTINLALRRARYWMKRTESQHARWPIQPPYRSLMEAVGDVGARNRNEMHRHSPLATELATFFGWSALILDQFAVWTVGHVLSESYLTERDTNLANRVGQVLERELDADEAKELKDKLRLFEQYLTTREFVDTLDTVLTKIETDLQLLGPNPAGHGLTIEFLKEQRCLWLVVQSLRDSFQPERHPARRGAPSHLATDAAGWLGGKTEARYFAHSRAYLSYLTLLREVLTKVLNPDLNAVDLSDFGTAADKVGGAPSRLDQPTLDISFPRQKFVQQVLDEEVDLLASRLSRPLFEPQRSQYRALLRTWQATITQRTSNATKILGALDSFNRHAYRVVADDLITTVTDLVAAQTPILPYHSTLPLRLLLNDAARDRPMYLQLLERTRRLVESTYLVGAMLEAVSESSARRGRGSIAPSEIRKLCREWCDEKDLECKWKPEGQHDKLVPVGRPVPELPGMWGAWAAILWELIANVSKYGTGDHVQDRIARFHFTLPEHTTETVLSGGFSLQIAGTRAFFDTFDPDLREEKFSARVKRPQPGKDPEDPGLSDWLSLDEVLELPESDIEEIARILTAEVTLLSGHAYSVAQGHSTGMGLPTIQMICEASDLQLRLVLRVPGQEVPVSARDILRAPVCAEILPMEADHER